MISGFSREADENYALQGHYAASSVKFVTEVSGQTICPISKGHLEDETGKLPHTSVRILPLLAA